LSPKTALSSLQCTKFDFLDEKQPINLNRKEKGKRHPEEEK